MVSFRAFRIGLAGVGVLVVLGIGWAAWQTWQVNQDLSRAVDHANAFQAAVEAGDRAAVERELNALQESSSSAADRTSGLTWSVLTNVPVFGDDARGVRAASEAVADLSVDGLEPLVGIQEDLKAILPKNGEVPVDAIRDLQDPVAQARLALDAAAAELAEEDPSGFVSPLAVKYRDLQDKITRAAEAMDTADRAVTILPDVLGGGRPQRFLVVFQNNAEIRTTGGLPGAVVEIEANDGRLEIVRQSAASALGRTPDPVLPLTSGEFYLYGTVFGEFFLDANFTPNFPRAADLMRAHWEGAFDTSVDGVVTLDVVSLGYLLEATGPISAGDRELTSANVVDELLHQVYLDYPDPAAQDVYFQDVAATAFDTFTSGVGDPAALIRQLAKGTNEHRILFHSFENPVQREITGTKIAGEYDGLGGSDAEPAIAVGLNDFTAAKMSYFLRYNVDVDATSCGAVGQTYAASARFESLAPRDAGETLPEYVTGFERLGAAPAGHQRVFVRIYAPPGGRVSDVTLQDEPLEVTSYDLDGSDVAQVSFEIAPQEAVEVEWQMRSGPGQTGDTSVYVTPGIAEGEYSHTVPTAC